MIATTLRVVLSLGTVLGLMWVVARFMPGRIRVRSNALLTVVARQPLGRNASLSVVTVGDRVLVLGVTDQKISLVTEMDLDELPEINASAAITAAADQVSSVPEPAAAAVVPTAAVVPRPPASGDAVPESAPDPALVARTAAEQHAFAAVLQGSILSPNTWKQAAAATRGSAGAHRGRRVAS